MLINIGNKKAPVYADPITVAVVIDKSSVAGETSEVCIVTDSGLSWINVNSKAESVVEIVNNHKSDNKLGFEKP